MAATTTAGDAGNNIEGTDGESFGGRYDEAVNQLCERFWKWRLEENPQFASYIGHHEHADKINLLSEAAYEARKVMCQRFLSAARSIDVNKCSNDTTAFNLLVLRHSLETYMGGLVVGANYNVLHLWHGFDQSLVSAIENGKYETYQDYKNCIKRLKAFPQQCNEAMKLLARGIQKQLYLPLVTIEAAMKRFDEATSADMDSSVFYKPFRRISAEVTESERRELQDEAKKAVAMVQNALKRTRGYLKQILVPLCRQKSLASSSAGKDLYTALIKFYCDADISPEVLHQLGLKGVKETRKKMKKLISKADYKGSVAEFRDYLKRLDSFVFKSHERQLEHYRHLLDAAIRPKLQKYFDYKPGVELRIKQVNMAAAARYKAPPLDRSKPGEMWVNSDNIRERPKCDMLPLLIHQGEPGHHLQTCFALEMGGLPDFRLYKDDRTYGVAPACFPIYCAYTEGWALYCEELGVEMGVYDDPSALFGYYCSDMLRFCSIVADTGIHAFDWTTEESVEYLVENAGLTTEHAKREVDKYTATPAQACSYKMGHVKFQELRQMAESKLKDNFDIKAFHRACLQCGQVPLNLLERSIKNYIDETLRAPESTSL